MYLYSYWSSFDIDISEYISIFDVIKSTSYTIFPVFIYLLFIIFFNFCISGNIDKYTKKIAEKCNILLDKDINEMSHDELHEIMKKIKLSTKISKSLKILFYLIFILVILIFLYFAFINKYHRWNFISGILYIIIIFTVLNSKLLEKYYEDSFFKFSVLAIVIFTIFNIFCTAKEKSYLIKQSYKFNYVYNGNFKSIKHFPPDEMFKYIGKAGDWIFFMTKNNRSIVTVNSDKIDAFELISYTSQEATKFSFY